MIRSRSWSQCSSDSIEEDEPHDASHEDREARIYDRQRPQVSLDPRHDEDRPNRNSQDCAGDCAEQPAREIRACDIDDRIASGDQECRGYWYRESDSGCGGRSHVSEILLAGLCKSTLRDSMARSGSNGTGDDYMKKNFEMRRARRKVFLAALGLAVCAGGCSYFAQQPEVYPDKFAAAESDRAWIPKSSEYVIPAQARPARTLPEPHATAAGNQYDLPALIDIALSNNPDTRQTW